MSASSDRLARLFLRYASPLAGLRRLPLIGPCVSWASGMFVPRNARTWVQVQRGPAAGLWLHLNPRTGQPYFEGQVEPEVQSVLQRQLGPGMVFYDIGANVGFFTILAARLVGPEGHVTSFEADPEVAARLREHVARNACAQVTVEQRAVWSESCGVLFERTDPRTSPDRGLGRVVSASAGDTISLDAVSLDDYVRTSVPPDFLKCDVEGAEVEVFRGAQNLLQERRPGILCEMHSEENRSILLAEFSLRGYACQPCGEHHVLALPR